MIAKVVDQIFIFLMSISPVLPGVLMAVVMLSVFVLIAYWLVKAIKSGKKFISDHSTSFD